MKTLNSSVIVIPLTLFAISLSNVFLTRFYAQCYGERFSSYVFPPHPTTKNRRCCTSAESQHITQSGFFLRLLRQFSSLFSVVGFGTPHKYCCVIAREPLLIFYNIIIVHFSVLVVQYIHYTVIHSANLEVNNSKVLQVYNHISLGTSSICASCEQTLNLTNYATGCALKTMC